MPFPKGKPLPKEFKKKMTEGRKRYWEEQRKLKFAGRGAMKETTPPFGEDPRKVLHLKSGKVGTTIRRSRPYVLPEEYEPGFLRDIDHRSLTYMRAQKNFDKICNQLGGEQELSLIQITFVEHYVFLQEVMEYFEAVFARQLGFHVGSANTTRTVRLKRKKGVPPEMMAQFLKCLSTLTTLGKTLGLKKRQVRGNLRTYLGRAE